MKMKLSTILATVSIALILSFLIQVTVVAPAHALTRYYNCIARVANKNATLSISNIAACYNMIFKGALNYYSIKQQSHVVTDDNSTNSEEKHDRGSGNNSVNNKEKTTIIHHTLDTPNVFG